MTPELLLAPWLALAEPARTKIVAAIVAAADAELRRIDNFYPSSYGDSPSVEVLALVPAATGGSRVHFIAHHLNYCFAQSGSDWADHYVLVGSGVLAGDDVRVDELAMAVHDWVIEYDYDKYYRDQTGEIVAKVRRETIARLCAHAS